MIAKLLHLEFDKQQRHFVYEEAARQRRYFHQLRKLELQHGEYSLIYLLGIFEFLFQS